VVEAEMAMLTQDPAGGPVINGGGSGAGLVKARK